MSTFDTDRKRDSVIDSTADLPGSTSASSVAVTSLPTTDEVGASEREELLRLAKAQDGLLSARRARPRAGRAAGLPKGRCL